LGSSQCSPDSLALFKEPLRGGRGRANEKEMREEGGREGEGVAHEV